MKWIIKKDRRTEKLNRHWQYCIGSGHASLALRADYLEQIKKVHDELGIERVRFHGIFHEDMQVHMSMADLMLVPGAEKFSTVSFRKIGMVYENLLLRGLKPFVELSFMPKHLGSSDARSALFYGGCIALPSSHEKWKVGRLKYGTSQMYLYSGQEVKRIIINCMRQPQKLLKK